MANRQKEVRRVGRPLLPKGEAKGSIVPVRFDADDLKLVTMAAKRGKKNVSEWIRETLRTAAEVQMFSGTLHEAIKQVLLGRENFTATTSEISDEIGRNGSYTRKDGKAARASQINARVRHYRDLFRFVAPGTVQLISESSAKPEAV